MKKVIYSSCIALLFLLSACANPSETNQRAQGTADREEGIILNSEGDKQF